MKLLTDSHFYIGQEHLLQGRPCQDHAATDTLGDAAFAVVSDGCSSAGEDEATAHDNHLLLGNTDIGARLTTSATLQALKAHWLSEQTAQPDPAVLASISARQRVLTGAARQILGLSWYDLYATNLYALVTESDGYAFVEGDGIVAYQLESGLIVMTRYEWEGNMPFYPAYAQLGYHGFIAAQGGDLDAMRATGETWMYDPAKKGSDEAYEGRTSTDITLREGVKGFVHALPDISTVMSVALFTDGATRFDGVDWRDVVVALMSFKVRQGQIATKRMTRYLRDCRRKNVLPGDDVGYAVILIDNDDSVVEKEEPATKEDTK